MIKILKLNALLLFLLHSISGFSQDKFTISGHIRDATNGEELIGANIFVEEIGDGTSTNVYGFYSLLFQDMQKVWCSSVAHHRHHHHGIVHCDEV